MPRPDNPLYTPLKREVRREFTDREGKKWIVTLSPNHESGLAMGLRPKYQSKKNTVWFPIDDSIKIAERILTHRKAMQSIEKEES